MYGIYPFEGRTSETLAVAIVKEKLKAPPEEMEKQYSKELKKILSQLLSQVCFSFLNFIDYYNLETVKPSFYRRNY
jgi:hypothetical protein